jgi:hypothetical protein
MVVHSWCTTAPLHSALPGISVASRLHQNKQQQQQQHQMQQSLRHLVLLHLVLRL